MESETITQVRANISISFLQLLARVHCQHVPLKLGLPHDLESGACLDIVGVERTGKTELLYHAVTLCILPDVWQGVRLFGCQRSVVYVDADGKFNLVRFTATLEQKIMFYASESGAKFSPQQCDDVVHDCLSRLFLVKPSSSIQLLASLHSLATTIQFEENTSLLVLDNLTAFHALERYPSLDASAPFYNAIISALRTLQSLYGLSLICTRQPLPASGRSDVRFLCKEWASFVTRRYSIDVTADKQLAIKIGSDATGPLSFQISNIGVHIGE